MKNSYAKKVDTNQPEIVEALRKAGAVVEHVHTVPGLFDIIVYFKGETYSVEIKDGSLVPSRRKLTLEEQKCKERIESSGVKYWIIESIGEALEMIKPKKICPLCSKKILIDDNKMEFCSNPVCDNYINYRT